MSGILKKIKETRDPELEVEWLSYFMMDAIIRKETLPLIYIYSFKTFNFDIIKELKDDCSIICFLSFLIILLLIVVGSSISVLIYTAYVADTIYYIIIVTIATTFLSFALCCIMSIGCYKYCYKLIYMSYRDQYFKEKNNYNKEKAVYFVV